MLFHHSFDGQVDRRVAIHQRQAEPVGGKNARRSPERAAVPNTVSVNLSHSEPQLPQEVATFCFGVAFASVCGSPPKHPVALHVPFVYVVTFWAECVPAGAQL